MLGIVMIPRLQKENEDKFLRIEELLMENEDLREKLNCSILNC